MDTARLGQMVPPARDAHIDFVRLAAEEPSSLYFEEFLRGGYEAWPQAYQQRFSGLATWRGVGGLKQSLRRLVGVPIGWRVLLASRSLPLLKLGASCQFRVCRNVLSTDLSWPTYQRGVATRALRTGNQVTVVAIRDRVFNDGWSADDVAQHLAVEYERCKCDGLFLPAVDHMGIRVPLRQIIDSIKAVADLRFVLVDAAQAFCHISLDECIAHADFVVAGCHKWMGAYLPLGIALYGRPRSQTLIDRTLRRGFSDPLTMFVDELEGAAMQGRMETANIPSLFTAAGALADHRWSVASAYADCSRTELLSTIALPWGAWKALSVAPELRTRIALLQCVRNSWPPPSAATVRRDWLETGYIVTGYDGGIARLSFASHQ